MNNKEIRLNQLVNILKENQKVTVKDLSQLLKVSEMTVKKLQHSKIVVFGLGITAVMFIVAFIRELFGTGCLSMNDLSGNPLFSIRIIPEAFTIPLFVQPTGAFLVLGICVAAFVAITTSINNKKANKAKKLDKEAA